MVVTTKKRIKQGFILDGKASVTWKEVTWEEDKE